MYSIFKGLFKSETITDKQEFKREKFFTNNQRILILSIFLTVEQIYYAVFVREPESIT